MSGGLAMERAAAVPETTTAFRVAEKKYQLHKERRHGRRSVHVFQNGMPFRTPPLLQWPTTLAGMLTHGDAGLFTSSVG